MECAPNGADMIRFGARASPQFSALTYRSPAEFEAACSGARASGPPFMGKKKMRARRPRSGTNTCSRAASGGTASAPGFRRAGSRQVGRAAPIRTTGERQGDVWGKTGAVAVNLGGRRFIKKKQEQQ